MSGDEAKTARGVSKLLDQSSRGIAAVGRGARYGGEGFGEECIPSENGDCLTIDAVVGRATSAEVIIIHAGKVIMNQGVGVDALDSAGGGKCVRLLASDSLGGGKAEDRSKSFSPREEAVAHRLMDLVGLGLGGDESVEGFLHSGETGFPVVLRIH